VYAVFVIAALALLAKRIHAANWVAWGPVLLLTFILPVVQLIGMVVRELMR
jgi:uncharacterized membrane protein YhaH (DUF805 family)